MSQEQYSLKNSRCVSLGIELASLNLLIHACMQGSATETQMTYLKQFLLLKHENHHEVVYFLFDISHQTRLCQQMRSDKQSNNQ
jgi:hypothetical protein